MSGRLPPEAGAAHDLPLRGGRGQWDGAGQLRGQHLGLRGTEWLADATGTQRAGLWVVGLVVLAGAGLTLALRAAPTPDDDRAPAMP